jgi:hypothetical protein
VDSPSHSLFLNAAVESCATWGSFLLLLALLALLLLEVPAVAPCMMGLSTSARRSVSASPDDSWAMPLPDPVTQLGMVLLLLLLPLRRLVSCSPNCVLHLSASAAASSAFRLSMNGNDLNTAKACNSGNGSHTQVRRTSFGTHVCCETSM